MKNFCKHFLLSLTVLVLFGCAYALVPATNDPRIKISQAYAMWEVGRYIPAEGLGLQALALAKKSGNLKDLANAHRYLGNFYKSRLYRQHAEAFREMGRYDPTSELSVSHFKKSEEIWKKLNDAWGVATDMFNQGTAYMTDGKVGKACKLFRDAVELYNSPDSVFTGSIHPWNSNFKDFPAMVHAFMEQANCKKFR